MLRGVPAHQTQHLTYFWVLVAAPPSTHILLQSPEIVSSLCVPLRKKNKKKQTENAVLWSSWEPNWWAKLIFLTIQIQSVNAEIQVLCVALEQGTEAILVLVSGVNCSRHLRTRVCRRIAFWLSVNLETTFGNPRLKNEAAALSPSCADGLMFMLVSGLLGKILQSLSVSVLTLC